MSKTNIIQCVHMSIKLEIFVVKRSWVKCNRQQNLWNVDKNNNWGSLNQSIFLKSVFRLSDPLSVSDIRGSNMYEICFGLPYCLCDIGYQSIHRCGGRIIGCPWAVYVNCVCMRRIAILSLFCLSNSLVVRNFWT